MTVRRAAGLGTLFVVLFTLGGTLLAGALGAFGDSDAFFIERYGDPGTRALEIAGGALLTVSAWALALFLGQVSLGDRAARRDGAADLGLLGAGLLLVSAAMLATAPLAISFGAFFGDAALTSPAVALAPQVGVVLLAYSFAWTLALVIAILSHQWRRASLAPGWLIWLGYGCALLLVVGAASGLALIGLPLWVGAVSVHLWKSAAGFADPPPEAEGQPASAK
jgi:hypothetical protein